jgi:hypothetical protein
MFMCFSFLRQPFYRLADGTYSKATYGDSGFALALGINGIQRTVRDGYSADWSTSWSTDSWDDWGHDWSTEDWSWDDSWDWSWDDSWSWDDTSWEPDWSTDSWYSYYGSQGYPFWVYSYYDWIFDYGYTDYLYYFWDYYPNFNPDGWEPPQTTFTSVTEDDLNYDDYSGYVPTGDGDWGVGTVATSRVYYVDNRKVAVESVFTMDEFTDVLTVTQTVINLEDDHDLTQVELYVGVGDGRFHF